MAVNYSETQHGLSVSFGWPRCQRGMQSEARMKLKTGENGAEPGLWKSCLHLARRAVGIAVARAFPEEQKVAVIIMHVWRASLGFYRTHLYEGEIITSGDIHHLAEREREREKEHCLWIIMIHEYRLCVICNSRQLRFRCFIREYQMRERRNACERRSVINVTYELILTCKVSHCLHELSISESICIMVMRAFGENVRPYFKSRMFVHILKRRKCSDQDSTWRYGCAASVTAQIPFSAG